MPSVLVTGSQCYAELAVVFPGCGHETIASTLLGVMPGWMGLGSWVGPIPRQYTRKWSPVLDSQYLIDVCSAINIKLNCYRWRSCQILPVV